MTYSYSQISQYLTCPRRYRHRYLDGCQEKEQWAAMVFGQAFEKAVAALFRHEDPAVVLFEPWSAYKDSPLLYPTGDTWDGMLQQGVQLLERSSRTDEFRFVVPKRSNRFNLPASLVPATTSFPTSTPSANLMARPAYWSGRLRRRDTRRNPPA